MDVRKKKKKKKKKRYIFANMIIIILCQRCLNNNINIMIILLFKNLHDNICFKIFNCIIDLHRVFFLFFFFFFFVYIFCYYFLLLNFVLPFHSSITFLFNKMSFSIISIIRSRIFPFNCTVLFLLL